MSGVPDIKPKDLLPPKKIGKLGRDQVFALTTKGGFCMVVAKGGGGVRTLGIGNHQAIARHVAKERNSELEFTDLAKAEPVPAGVFTAEQLRLAREWTQLFEGKTWPLPTSG